MKNKVNLIVLGFIFILIVVGSCLLFFKSDQSSVSHAKITIEESEIYQHKEIESALEKVFEKFREFPATLEEIWYQDGEDRFAVWAEIYGKDEAIVFYSNFTTNDDANDQEQGFLSNEKYEKWMWILTRNQGGDWKLESWGWG